MIYISEMSDKRNQADYYEKLGRLLREIRQIAKSILF